MYHTMKKGELYKHRRQVSQWTPHTDNVCELCSHIRIQLNPKGGRKKKKKIAGRPKRDSNRALMTHVMRTAPAAWCPEGTSFAQSEELPLLNLKCAVCKDILLRPLEIATCSSLVCCQCLIKHLETAEDLQCPCCSRHDLKDFSTVRAPTPYFLKILSAVKVVCNKCGTDVSQREYHSHSCSSHTCQASPELTVDEILQKSPDAPLTAVEEELQCHLVKRALTQTTRSSIKIKTGGQVKQKYTNITYVYNSGIMVL